ncbi:mitogen-activated protein kinase kinase kinase 1-like [Lingula anatina]|uniref:Mitogen-activated protein kinase kinase kinase 1-like n=1 Tax=Lingula anatina TaxID=7574 RepID=A0A2R2MTP2_LINAN|nr:mitogen-activated protein kinase kinase kinase 1-like [Lingula anatina]|eukprot:XP_023933616.1 mitogen-activated protein kinase kinase kinase 1-like [Lingula anatina]
MLEEEGVTVPSGSPAVSLPHPPPPAQPHEEVVLPHADPLPQEHRDMAAPWIEILGEDLISCLFSKNWTVRETGLRRVSQEAVAVFLPASGEGRTGARVSSDRHEAKTQMLSTCFSILALMCGDPVYRVFVAALKTLRTVLAYVPCRDDTQRKELQDLLVPVLNTILIKCADGNRRTSLLSISTIVELGKGQSGELAIGREIFNSGQGGIGGVSFILTCMLEEYTLEEVQWQWLLGRLCALDRLMEEFPLEFTVEAARGEHISDHPRLHAVLNFVFKALKHSHQRIAKLARRTFIFAVRPTAHIPGIFSEVKEMLNHLDSSLHIRMLRHLAHIFTEPALLVPYHNITYQNGPAVDFEIPGDRGEGSDTPRSLSPDMPLPSSQGSSPMPQTPTEDGDCNDGIGEDNRLDNMTPNNNELGSDLQNNNVPNDNDVEEQTHQDEFLGENGLEASVQPDEAAAGSKSAIAQDNHVDGDTKKLEETTDRSNVNGELPGNAENHVSGTKTAKDANRNLKQANPVLLTPPNTPLQQSLDKEQVSLSAKKVPQSESTSSPLAGAQPKDWGDITTKQLECDCIEPPQPHGIHMHHKSQGNRDQEEIQPSLPSCGENAHHKAQGYGNCDDRQDEAQAAPLNCNCLIKPCPCEDKFRLPQEPCSPKKTYLCSACRRYSILSTEDSTELTLSPAGLDEKPVSFKTEVASSPRVSPDASQDDGASSDPCYCKEEVEIEEAQALAAAMEASTKQEDLPIIPQLGSREKDEITIHIQDEGGGENDEPQPKAYLDGIHWQRGPLIGTGAYSTCYQARDVKTGTIMAVKQISFCRNTAVEQAQVVEAIEDEIRMMAKLNHVNVVRILGATRQGCHFNMFVEWMPGGAVACLLATYGPFSEVVITSYTQQVLRGLAYLHDNQILHRDMKDLLRLFDLEIIDRLLHVSAFCAYL